MNWFEHTKIYSQACLGGVYSFVDITLEENMAELDIYSKEESIMSEPIYFLPN